MIEGGCDESREYQSAGIRCHVDMTFNVYA